MADRSTFEKLSSASADLMKGGLKLAGGCCAYLMLLRIFAALAIPLRVVRAG